MKPTYQIVIESNGDTTTAKMFVNGKEVKTTTAKRNPADEANWRIGAQTAFDRLWQRKEKPEGQKQEGGFKIGDRVVANKKSYYEGKHGRIVLIQYSKDPDFCKIGVEFDEYIGGHDCGGNAKPGHGWWFADWAIRHEKPTKPKVREVARKAKEGEWVRIVNIIHCTDCHYENGDVLRVVREGDFLDDLSCGGAGAHCVEYVVLEGYQPGRDGK